MLMRRQTRVMNLTLDHQQGMLQVGRIPWVLDRLSRVNLPRNLKEQKELEVITGSTPSHLESARVTISSGGGAPAERAGPEKVSSIRRQAYLFLSLLLPLCSRRCSCQIVSFEISEVQRSNKVQSSFSNPISTGDSQRQPCDASSCLTTNETSLS